MGDWRSVSSGLNSQFALQAARGKIPGVRVVSVAGRATGLGASPTFLDIWDGQTTIGQWIPPKEDRIHDISSTSALDSIAGTGAQKILVQGISGGKFANEIVDTNGTTNVPTLKAYDSVHRLTVVQPGSTLTNQGNISAVAQVDGTTTSLMLAGNNRTFQATFKTPDDSEYYATDVSFSVERSGGGGTDADFRVVFFQQDPPIVIPSLSASTSSSGTSAINFSIGFPVKITSDTYVKVQVAPTQANTTADGSLRGATVEKDLQ